MGYIRDIYNRLEAERRAKSSPDMFGSVAGGLATALATFYGMPMLAQGLSSLGGLGATAATAMQASPYMTDLGRFVMAGKAGIEAGQTGRIGDVLLGAGLETGVTGATRLIEQQLEAMLSGAKTSKQGAAYSKAMNIQKVAKHEQMKQQLKANEQLLFTEEGEPYIVPKKLNAKEITDWVKKNPEYMLGPKDEAGIPSILKKTVKELGEGEVNWDKRHQDKNYRSLINKYFYSYKQSGMLNDTEAMKKAKYDADLNYAVAYGKIDIANKLVADEQKRQEDILALGQEFKKASIYELEDLANSPEGQLLPIEAKIMLGEEIQRKNPKSGVGLLLKNLKQPGSPSPYLPIKK